MHLLHNFKKIVNQGKQFDAQLKIFAKQFELFVKKKIKVVVAPYENLHGRIDYLKHRVNNKLREMLLPELAIFETALERAGLMLQLLQSRKTLTFLALIEVESEEEEEVLYNITRKPVDLKGKGKRKKSESEENKRLEKKKKKNKERKELKEAMKKSK